MRPSGAAYNWEFRWRWPILVGSQPALALMAHIVSGAEEPWYAPTLSAGIGWLAVFVATLGILLRIQATTSLRAAVMASDDLDTSRFVSHGLYRSVRNPLYVSSLLLFGGYGLCFGWAWAAGFVLFHWWRYQRIVLLEESCLRLEWGAEFDAYCHSVPRWLPCWRDLRCEFGRWLSWHGVIANSLYVGILSGIVVSAAQGNLGWVIPFECAGGIAMATYYWTQSRETISEGSSDAELAVSDPALSHAPQAASLIQPHFSIEPAELHRAIAILEEVAVGD